VIFKKRLFDAVFVMDHSDQNDTLWYVFLPGSDRGHAWLSILDFGIHIGYGLMIRSDDETSLAILLNQARIGDIKLIETHATVNQPWTAAQYEEVDADNLLERASG
jgi:hypothetical protein